MRSPKLILASSSPRRRQLLEEAGYDFEVVAPPDNVECGLCSEEGPAGLVTELAYRKAAAVRRKFLSPQPPVPSPDSRIIVAADTVAGCDGLILGKPRDEPDARAMLEQLRGRQHRVLTGVCVWPLRLPLPLGEGRGEGAPLIRVAATKLRMDQLSDAEIGGYLSSGQWVGKAGAFGYQDRLGWVRVEEGSESNVVGLPMELLGEMLEEVGVR